MKRIQRAFTRHPIGIAVDLGSTTIAASCMDLAAGEEMDTFSFANPQRIYGADVITRIRRCIEDRDTLAHMGNLVKDTLWEHLREHLGTDSGRVEKIVYSGNTTMLHILRGMSVEGLASAPFTPVTIEYGEKEEKFVFQTEDENESLKAEGLKTDSPLYTAVYPPGFSAFVGADILTGAEFLSMGKTECYDLLVDLGTNGEMLLLNKDCGFAASTACGPVFDHAVTGAVYGSESIKAVANCIRRRLIDDTGTLKEPFFDMGIAIDKGFVIRQENIRNFQLAKGAIYAGIHCLLKKAGIVADQIGNVYISGGLGFYMDIRDAFTVKMLPREFAGKITVSGNSSLEGAKKLLLADKTEKADVLSEYEAVRKRTVCFELADFEEFQDIYMASLNF